MLKDAVPLDACRRALVVNFGHYGDVLLATPVLRVLKAHAPHLEIDALVYDQTAPMLEGHPALSELHTVGRRWRDELSPARFANEYRLLAALRRRRYDLVLHLSKHARGAWLARLLGARYRVGPARGQYTRFWRKSFTHLFQVVHGNRRHRVEKNLDALRRIGVQPALEERRVEFVPGAAAEQVAAKLAPARPFILFHPDSRWRFKCWPADKSGELIDRLAGDGHTLVLTGAPGETDLADAILAHARTPVINLAGKLSIKELGALIGRARLFLGVDSMPMHLAAAMGVPTVALFGPSYDEEWGPWGVPRRIVTSSHPCRPCGLKGCGGSEVSECLTELPVEVVYMAVRDLLAQVAGEERREAQDQTHAARDRPPALQPLRRR
ncbi:MAG TPA: putative lipopolysaccharide heptosyltransferase III [Burkholderiales bacterium]